MNDREHVDVSAELVDLLRCPATMQRLRFAPPGVLARVAAGGLSFQSGKPVSLPIDGGLLREDGKVLYAIRCGIPVVLVEEGIVLG